MEKHLNEHKDATRAGREPALYFDCVCGIAGDMCLGALVDLGCPVEHVRDRLAGLGLSEHYALSAEPKQESGICGTLARVEQARHEHAHRGLGDILRLIDGSGLEPEVAEPAARVFRAIGEAESRVHGVPVEKIHFHEIGAVDSIVDIVGTCIAMAHFGPARLFSSPMKTGRGMIRSAHGMLPLPAPAVVLLACGRTIEHLDVEGELTTPTGAGILAALTEERRSLSLRIDAVGYGYGTRKVGELPNVLRVVRGTVAPNE